MSNKYEKWWERNRDGHKGIWGHRSAIEHLKWFEGDHMEKRFPVGTRVKVRGPSEGTLPFTMDYMPRDHFPQRESALTRARGAESRGVVIAVGASPGFAGVLVRRESGEPRVWDYRPSELVNLDARERVFGKKK